MGTALAISTGSGMVAMEGRWLVFSGKSSPHKFGQSGLWAPPIATYGVLSPTLTPEAKPKPVTLLSQALGTAVEV